MNVAKLRTIAALASAAAVTALAPAIVARAQTLTLAAEQSRKIDAAATTALAGFTAPGISVAVARDGVLVYAKGFGLRDVASAKPVDDATVFALGPITKQFTAAAIEMLAASGKLSVDATLATYVPNAPHAGEIRVRDLLRETSGLPDYLTSADLTVLTTSARVTPRQLLDSIAGKPLDFAPGTRYEQSGTNYIALGAIVEAVSGKTYGEFVRTQIAEPLGLTTLSFGPPPAPADRTTGYDVTQYDRPAEEWTAASTFADGGLYASAADVAKWDAAFFGFKLLPKAIVEDMMTPAQADTTFACGSFAETLDGHVVVRQHGGVPGTSVSNNWIPDIDAAVVVLGNSLAFNPRDIARAATLALEPQPVSVFEEPADLARARAEYGNWQHGTVDPKHYGAAMQSLIASPAARDVTAELRSAGDPTSFAFEEQDAAPGGTAHRYRIETAHAAFAMTLVYKDGGPILSIKFTFLP